MDKEEFIEWRKSAMTEWFMGYLSASVKEESEIIAETISNGGVVEQEHMLRTSSVCLTMKRIIEIDFDEIEGFFNAQDNRKQNPNRD